MKRLTNVSAFLLLLFPVFLVMLLAFTTDGNKQNNQRFALKSKTNTSFIKTSTNVLKK